jgi:RND family efflux transporter MFP subunit
MAQAVSLYPIRIKEADSSLESAQARLALTKTNLERCEVRAPFDGRIKNVSLEKEQYVGPGQNVVTLADDSILEIHVPLDSRDARQWLRFKNQQESGKTAWFSELEPVPCRIRWTEMKDGNNWKGRLHRVVKFDPQTRTLTVAIRVKSEDAWLNNPETLPLVEGMFCSVSIPGRLMKDVIRLPRRAVSFKNTVYISNDSRLKTIPVKVLRSEGDYAFITEGLRPGDQVITTRLVDPLENALLDIENTGSEKSAS